MHWVAYKGLDKTGSRYKEVVANTGFPVFQMIYKGHLYFGHSNFFINQM